MTKIDIARKILIGVGIASLLIFSGCSDDTKEKELALKEKELALKEKELQLQTQQLEIQKQEQNTSSEEKLDAQSPKAETTQIRALVEKINDNGFEALTEQRVKDEDLQNKTKNELRLMRNFLFAHHGYKFQSKDLQQYFSQYEWYEPNITYITDDDLSEIEKYNILRIKYFENLASSLPASFDCAKAQLAIEKRICASSNLSSLDGQMGQLYVTHYRVSSGQEQYNLKISQRTWINERNSKCENESDTCIETMLNERIDHFKNSPSSSPSNTTTSRYMRDDAKQTVTDTTGSNQDRVNESAEWWIALKGDKECKKIDTIPQKYMQDNFGSKFHIGEDRKTYKTYEDGTTTYYFENSEENCNQPLLKFVNMSEEEKELSYQRVKSYRMQEMIDNGSEVFIQHKYGKIAKEEEGKRQKYLASSGLPSIFNDKCSGCHGLEGGIQALGKSKKLTQMNKNEIIEALNGYKNKTYGGSLKSLMYGQVENLSDKDISDIANYFGIKAATAVDNAVYGKCKACHGPDGKTKALGRSATIAGQTQAELVTKIKGYKAGTINTIGMGMLMKANVEKLTDVEIEAVAAYIATFK